MNNDCIFVFPLYVHGLHIRPTQQYACHVFKCITTRPCKQNGCHVCTWLLSDHINKMADLHMHVHVHIWLANHLNKMAGLYVHVVGLPTKMAGLFVKCRLLVNPQTLVCKWRLNRTHGLHLLHIKRQKHVNDDYTRWSPCTCPTNKMSVIRRSKW